MDNSNEQDIHIIDQIKSNNTYQKISSSDIQIGSNLNIALDGYFYDDNHELLPNFMKKLAISKNQKSLENQKNKKEYDSDNNKDSFESGEDEAQKDINELLLKNIKFVKEASEKNPEWLKEISSPQHPKYLIISCSDSRILISKILGTHPGELFVHRNIGNIVHSADFNFKSVLSYAVENLKVKNIIVLGHTDCGAIKTSLSNKYHGLVDHWLLPIKGVVEKNHDELDKVMKTNPEKIANKLSELNVREQVINLCKDPIVQKAWNDGQKLFIHGLLFEMETGYIRNLNTMKKEWKNIEDIHMLDFN